MEIKNENEEILEIKIPVCDAEKSKVAWNMIEHNKITELIKFNYYYVDDKVCFRYEISTVNSLKEYFDNNTNTDIYYICRGIVGVIQDGQKYLLNENEYLISLDSIYWNPFEKKIYLCYVPGYCGDFRKNYTTLVEKLLKHVNHSNKREMEFVYGMYDYLAGNKVSFQNIYEYIEKNGVSQSVKIDNKEDKTGLNNKKDKTNQIIIGRQDNCNIVIPLSQISRKHAKVIREKGKMYLEDLNSLNGTYLCGKKLIPGKRCELKKGDEIQLADISLCF